MFLFTEVGPKVTDMSFPFRGGLRLEKYANVDADGEDDIDRVADLDKQ